MNGNTELLNYIYQNAEMGKNTISQLIDISKDGDYKGLLESQLEVYTSIYDRTRDKIQKMDDTVKGINVFDKSSTYTMINIKTMMNKSSSHISEMLIQGSTMGIIDLTKKLEEYRDADEDILSVARELLDFEEKNIEEYKEYLQ